MSFIKGVVVKSTAPTVNDDGTKGFYIGYKWVDTTALIVYELVDNTTGAAVWQQGAGGYYNSIAINSDTTLQKYDRLVFVDSSSAPVTVTLPASPDLDETHHIIDIGNATTNNITIDGNGNTISGDATFDLIWDYESLETIFDNTQHIAI